MDGGSRDGSEVRFASYVEALGAVLGHADRHAPMRDYCLGLMMPLARKSVEPLAAVTAPATVAAKHQCESAPKEDSSVKRQSILIMLMEFVRGWGSSSAPIGTPAARRILVSSE